MMASIAMMDCHFIMFFNNPPNLTTTELQFDLPAEEEGIDILDSFTWQFWAENERKNHRPPPLNQFIKQLLTDKWCGPDDARFKNLSIFSLYVVISGENINNHTLNLEPVELTHQKHSFELFLDCDRVFVIYLMQSNSLIGHSLDG
jgi:hypothetical protein